MTCTLFDGKIVATQLRSELHDKIKACTTSHRPPALAVILIGEDVASQIYVANKRKACLEVGITSLAYDLLESTNEKDLLELIDNLNNDPEIDGILVQLPLPPHINTTTVLDKIAPQKDVDGFNPFNLGRLAQGNPLLRPCTPYGIIQMLNFYQINLPGKNAVVIGASTIVGRPMALELLNAKTTVTICHRQTKNLKEHVEGADLLVVATGVLNVVPSEWLKPHQIIIDVGIHRLANGRLRGDVDFTTAKTKVAAITPVPGGVGPMTILTLLQNTFKAYQQGVGGKG